jgi:hypothetical protein
MGERVSDFLVGVLCGAFFLGSAWWMATHEFWSTRDAREAAERNPARWRQVNYRVDALVTGRIVPAALVLLGVAAVVWGVSRLFS